MIMMMKKKMGRTVLPLPSKKDAIKTEVPELS
jgi:hypothetical protein